MVLQPPLYLSPFEQFQALKLFPQLVYVSKSFRTIPSFFSFCNQHLNQYLSSVSFQLLYLFLTNIKLPKFQMKKLNSNSYKTSCIFVANKTQQVPRKYCDGCTTIYLAIILQLITSHAMFVVFATNVSHRKYCNEIISLQILRRNGFLAKSATKLFPRKSCDEIVSSQKLRRIFFHAKFAMDVQRSSICEQRIATNCLSSHLPC